MFDNPWLKLLIFVSCFSKSVYFHVQNQNYLSIPSGDIAECRILRFDWHIDDDLWRIIPDIKLTMEIKEPF